MAGENSGKIFINYRRSEDRGFARLLFDKLKSVFGEDRLFMDVETLPGTNDFPETLAQEIRACSVLLVMIGKEWLWLEDEKGRRLGRADDFVTMEIALALKLGKVVIPVRVNDVPPLEEKDLPPVLRQLWRCNALPLANDRFEGDVLKIAKTVGNRLGWSEADVTRALLSGPANGKSHDVWVREFDLVKNSSDRKEFTELLRQKPPKDVAELIGKALEKLDWKTVSTNPNIETLEWFLQSHPDGQYAPEARQKLQQLRDEARQRAKRQAQERIRQQRDQEEEAERQAQEQRDAAWRREEDRRRQQQELEWEAAQRKKRIRRIAAAALASVCLALFIGRTVQHLRATPGSWFWWQRTGGFVWHVGDAGAAVAFTTDGGTIVSHGVRNNFNQWALTNGQKTHSVHFGASALDKVAFSAGARTALAGGGCDTEAEKVNTNKAIPYKKIPYCTSAHIKYLDVESGKVLRSFTGVTPASHIVLALSPDGSLALSDSCEEFHPTYDTLCIKGTVIVWNVATGAALRTLKGHSGHISALAFSPGGSIIITGSSDGTLKLWDASTGRELRSFAKYAHLKMQINAVALSMDGRLLLSGSNGRLDSWDAVTGREVHSFNGYPLFVNSVAFSTDGRYALSGSAFPGTEELRLWDVSTGQTLRRFPAGPAAAIFSPDGRYAVSSTHSGTLTLWDLAPYVDGPR